MESFGNGVSTVVETKGANDAFAATGGVNSVEQSWSLGHHSTVRARARSRKIDRQWGDRNDKFCFSVFW